MGTWSGWDIAVVFIAVLQIAVLVTLALQLARLRANVRGVAGKGVHVATRGQALVRAGLAALMKNRDRAGAVLEQARLTRTHYVRLTDRTATAHLAFNWTRLFATVATVRTAQGYLHYAQGLLARVRKQPAPVAKRTRPARQPLVDRMGLVPPVVVRLRKYHPAARTALEVYKELQRRGIIGRKI